MRAILTFVTAIALIFTLGGCNPMDSGQPTSSSGVTQASVKVTTDANGNTAEQLNIIKRLERTQDPDAIAYLYVLSAFTGDIILQDVVKGKVTSSKKRLSPTSVWSGRTGEMRASKGPSVRIGSETYTTNEVIQDDGTYGSSMEYLYYFDQDDELQQVYVTGSMLVHVSTTPRDHGRVVHKTEDVSGK